MDRKSLGIRSNKMMEEQGSGGQRVQIISTEIRRVRNHKKTIKRNCGCVAHNCHSKQKFISQMPYHAVFGFLIPLLISLLQVNSQGINKYSFEKHPENLWAFLLAIFVYCVAFAADMKSHSANYAKLYRFIAVLSASLCLVSLISIFHPPLHGRSVFIPLAFVSIVLSFGFIISTCRWIYQMRIKTFFQVLDIWNRFRGSDLMEQPRLPV